MKGVSCLFIKPHLWGAIIRKSKFHWIPFGGTSWTVVCGSFFCMLHFEISNNHQSDSFHPYLHIINLWLTGGHFIVIPMISTLAHNWLCTPTSHHLTHASAASRCAPVSPACTVCVTGQSVFGETDCLFCSVPVFLHSHLLFCLPVFDSRQVTLPAHSELSAALTLHSCFPPPTSKTHTLTHTITYKIPLPHCTLYLPASAAQFICPAVYVGDVNYLYCQPPLLRLRPNSPFLGANGFFCTHCSCLCACVLLVWLPKCHSVQKLA